MHSKNPKTTAIGWMLISIFVITNRTLSFSKYYPMNEKPENLVSISKSIIIGDIVAVIFFSGVIIYCLWILVKRN